MASELNSYFLHLLILIEVLYPQRLRLRVHDLVADPLLLLVVDLLHLDQESANDRHMLSSELFDHTVSSAVDLVLARIPDAIGPARTIQIETSP